jgi:hypothetical protein
MENEMTPDPFEYDVALSFAAEDRAAAEELARLLKERNITVFLDEYNRGNSGEKNVIDHLVNLYDRKARYCVLFISKHYPLQTWTNEERASASEAALRDADEYILPLRLDDTGIPGLDEVPETHDFRQASLERLAALLKGKLSQTQLHPGPPPESHDLRSGNIPSSGNDGEDSLP